MATKAKETKRQERAQVLREEAEATLRREAKKRDETMHCPVCKTLRWIYYNGIACPNMCEGKVQKWGSELETLRSYYPELVVTRPPKKKRLESAILDKYKKPGEYVRRVVKKDDPHTTLFGPE